MDTETVDYLLSYYSQLLPEKMRLTLKHVLHSEKVAAIADATTRSKMEAMMLRRGWLSEDEDVLALLKDGVAACRWQLARKIHAENGGDSLLNKCPACGRLTRTPTAQQCRHCGANWHGSQRS